MDIVSITLPKGPEGPKARPSETLFGKPDDARARNLKRPTARSPLEPEYFQN